MGKLHGGKNFLTSFLTKFEKPLSSHFRTPYSYAIP